VFLRENPSRIAFLGDGEALGGETCVSRFLKEMTFSVNYAEKFSPVKYFKLITLFPRITVVVIT